MQSYAELNPNITCYHCSRTATETQHIILSNNVMALHLCDIHMRRIGVRGSDSFDTEDEALIYLVTRNLCN